MYYRGMSGTQFVFNSPSGGTSTVADTEAEARTILERSAGNDPSSPRWPGALQRTHETAPLPSIEIGGRRVLDPDGLRAYKAAMAAGTSNMEAIDAAHEAAVQAAREREAAGETGAGAGPAAGLMAGTGGMLPLVAAGAALWWLLRRGA